MIFIAVFNFVKIRQNSTFINKIEDNQNIFTNFFFIFLGHDLTAREKIRLNEMVVVELEKDLKAAEANETRHIMDITSLKLELKKTTVKLNHLQNQRSKVKAAMDTEGEESKSTKSDDRQAPPPQTRKSARFQDENSSQNNAKKPKLMAENENARSTRSRRSRASHLEKGMPDNPFTKNKVRPHSHTILKVDFCPKS